jgi:hypothetical protein
VAVGPDATNRRRRNRIVSAVPGWIVDPNNPAEPWEVRVKDVSRFGVGFESCQSLSSGETGKLRIGRGPIELARAISVVRCEPTERGTFRIGAVFC